MPANPNDPYNWAGIAAQQQDPFAYYDVNADPFGVAGYMTPQFGGTLDKKGNPEPYDIETQAKQGNAMQDYYQILSNPVTQWLNMATTGSGSLDLQSMLGGAGGAAPYVASLQSSDDQYLQTVGQQLAAGASPETIKLQMRQVPELADDDNKLKIYDAAADNGWKAMTDQKATGPMAQFEKLGLTNPLQTYTDQDLPGDVAANPDVINRWFGGAAQDEPQQWNDYHDFYRNAAEALRRQNDELGAKLPNQPSQAAAIGGVESSRRSGLNAATNTQARGQAAIDRNTQGGRQQRFQQQTEAIHPAQQAIDENNRKLKDYEGRVKEAGKYLKGPKRASVQDIVSGVNKIRAAQLTQQGRTPARDQARSMLSWLSSQNYG